MNSSDMIRSTRSGRARLALLFVVWLGACRAGQPAAALSMVVTYRSPMWYEETGRYFQVAPDGRLAIYGTGPRSRLYDLATARENSAAWRASMDQVRSGAFDASGNVVRLGQSGSETGWYAERDGRLTRLDIPAAALPRFAPGRSRTAYFTPGEPSIALRGRVEAAVTHESCRPLSRPSSARAH